MMLCEKPEITDNKIYSGGCVIEICSSEKCDVRVEEMILDDIVFSSVWGEKIYKTVIKPKKSDKGNVNLKIYENKA